MTDPVGATTTSFAEGMKLAADLRATTPEQMAATVARLEDIQKNSRDYVVGGPSMQMINDIDPAAWPPAEDTPPVTKTQITIPGALDSRHAFTIGDIAHRQISEKMGIPIAYYRRMLGEAKHLLRENVNHWFEDSPRNFLLRTVDGRARALLSDGCRNLDSHDLFFHGFNVGKEVGATVQRLDYSEERFFMRLVLPEYMAKIDGRVQSLKDAGTMFSSGYRKDNGTWQVMDDDDPSGGWLCPAVVMSNSEVGLGSLTVESAAFSPGCTNYIMRSLSLRKVHLGERREGGLQYATDTIEKKDELVWLEVRDLVKDSFDTEAFTQMILAANEAEALVLEEPTAAVDSVVSEYGFSDEQKQSMLNDLMAAGRPTAWKLLNSVTALAHKTDDVNESAALDRIGGEIMENAAELVKVTAVR